MTDDRFNVRISSTGITHARDSARQVTRCGIQYVRNGQYVIGDMGDRPMGHRSDADVDCMTCLVKPEWHPSAEYEKGFAEGARAALAQMTAVKKGPEE